MNRRETGHPAGAKRSSGAQIHTKNGIVRKGNGTVDRAINDIRYIRDLIDTSRDFFVSGWSGVAAGLVTMLGAALTAWFVHHASRWTISETLWTLWVLIGAALMGIDILFFIKRSREEAHPVFSMILLKGILVEVIIAFQGLVLTLLLIRMGMFAFIPGAWLMALGTVMTALGIFVPGGAWIIGLVSLAASVTAFITPGLGLWCLGLAGAAMILWGVGYLIVRGR